MSTTSVWNRLWKNRKAWGESSRERELAQFLPPALEIQETPSSPLAKWLARIMMLLFSLAVLWAVLGKMDVVATAEGKIIPSSRTKQIQPLQKAIVKAILVRDGERVVKGQALIELDATQTFADQNRTQSELNTSNALLEVSRSFLTWLENADTLALPGSTVLNSGQANPGEALYHKLLLQQQRDYQAQLAALNSLLNKTQAEQAAARETKIKLEQTLPIITRRSETMRDLHQKGFASEINYLELEQERIRQAQDLAAYGHNLLALQATETEILQKQQALTAQMHGHHLRRISELQKDIAVLQEELTKAQNLNARQTLYAPVTGRVQELTVHTEGGVVTEAQQLMMIVPEEEHLEVEARLLNKDIGFVREGMMAEVKIHTFPFTRYGVIAGEVLSVSNDAVVSEQHGLIYTMRLKMERNTVNVNGSEIWLLPGMAVTAEVKTDERRIASYFIRPTKRYLEESLRER